MGGADRLRTAAALVCMALAGAPAAAAAPWNGERPPNDPLYDIAEEQPLTHTFHDEHWFLYSFIPRTAPLATDPEGAAGMSVDLAWRRYGAGIPDVRVAYIEGGVNWRTEAARRELAGRAYLNLGELPRPLGASRYDANGDGQVSVDDYAEDPRIRRPYINRALTPEDLIVAFSDGRDGDRNGYTDDISGWNFSRANNDPQTEDSAYTHANNQMIRAVAQGDNGYAGVGICPRCTVIPIKAADEAVVRPDRFAQSIYFAIDSGASVVVAVVAELGYTRLVERALDYAWRKGAVVVLASNDFNSADHQSGMFWPRVWPGNGLVADTTGALDDLTAGLTRGFRNRSNYTSFGPHSLFSTPNSGGSTSESTPTQGGIAALLAAYGRRAAREGRIGQRLDAGEIKQVLRAAASPITSLTAYNYPGRPDATFSLNYGYGRPNMNRALRAVLRDRIPPVPDIRRPSWYALYDPTTVARVPISGTIRAPRAARVRWRVQWALGAEPADRDFRTLARGRGARRVSGRLAVLDLARIPRSFWERPLEHTDDLSSTEQHTITLRLRARDDRGLVGEDRRTIAVFHDPMLRPGFPRRVGIGLEAAPVPADLDGDGIAELVFGDSNGAVHAVDGRGRSLPGWPALTRPLPLGLGDTPAGRTGAVPPARDAVATPPSVGDLDGDGSPEVVVTALSGRVYVFGADGQLRRGWPRRLGADAAGLSVPPPDRPYTRLPSAGAYGPAALVSLPGGSKLDVVVGGWDGRLYAFGANGTAVPGWPVRLELPPASRPQPPFIHVHDHKIVATPTLADLDGDGQGELVVKSQEFALANPDLFGAGSRFYVHAVQADGNLHPGGPLVAGWPVEVQGVLGAYGTAQDFITEGGDAASSADLDGDGDDEVLQPLPFGFPALIDRARVTNARAARARRPNVARLIKEHPAAAAHAAATTGAPLLVPVGFTATGTLARLRGSVAYTAGGTDLLSLSSLLFPGQHIRIIHGVRLMDPRLLSEPPGFPAPLMGLPFLTAPAVADVSGDGRPEIINGTDTSNVAAVQDDGSPAPGWPKFTGGWTVFTPAVADLDGDGRVEVAATTREGYLFVWDTPGRTADVQAPAWHQDPAHTGRFEP